MRKRSHFRFMNQVAAILFLILVSIHPSAAQNAQPRLTDPEIKKVVISNSYYFTIRYYRPPLKVTPITSATASYLTPQLAAVAFISAMSSGDFTWWRSIWTKDSNALMDKVDKEQSQPPDFWVGKWRQIFSGRDTYLDAQIQTGEFFIMVYRTVTPGTDLSKPSNDELAVPFKKDGNRWYATQELSEDPVLLYWNMPDIKIERMARPPESTRNP